MLVINLGSSCSPRKRLHLAVAAIFTLVVSLSTVGCMQFDSDEGYLEPSPSGNFVASLLIDSTFLPIPTEGFTLSESAKFRLRRSDGDILMTVHLDKVSGSRSSEAQQVLWSEDEKYVACNVLGTAWI